MNDTFAVDPFIEIGPGCIYHQKHCSRGGYPDDIFTLGHIDSIFFSDASGHTRCVQPALFFGYAQILKFFVSLGMVAQMFEYSAGHVGTQTAMFELHLR
jgi:hypothetical protein